MRQEAVATERQSVSVAEARELILRAVQPLGDETVLLLDATGRALAEDVASGIWIPPVDNSAMDGFAVRAQDVARAPALLRVVDDLPAGRTPARKLGPGEAARIMTGAAIPEGADAVVMIEHTEPAQEDRVRVLEPVERGENVRRAGEDVRPGTPIAVAGARLRPALIGMLAAIGRTSVRVAQRPRVAVLSTGDELVEPDRLAGDGRIVTSNSYNLQAALRELGCPVTYLGIAPDRPDAIEARFRQALACDAVISTGGVSVGDRDWIKQVLAGLGGRMRLWRVRMKPGAPLAFAEVHGRPVFGLPGNPVSTLVAFEQFVRPALLRMMGLRALHRPVIRAELAEPYRKAPGRLHFVRVRLEARGERTVAHATGDQGSHILLSMVQADGLAIAPEEAAALPAGSAVCVQLLDRDDLREEPGF
jgi:molybdopterin molybdotransferase